MSAFTAVKVLASGPFAGRSSTGDKAAASAPIGSSACRILRSVHPHQPFPAVSSSSPSILRPIQAVSSSDVLSSKIEPNSPPSDLVISPSIFADDPGSFSRMALSRGGFLQLITREEALDLYEDMVLGRSFEDMCAQMYYRGKMFGFVHLYNGQEAVSTGFIRLLKKEDSVVSTYRDHVHALSKGVPARAVMAELFGKATGCCRGQGGSMHMFSAEHNLLGGFAFIGEGIPVATGAAFTSRYRREVLKEANCDYVTLAFFGDGTCNNGQFFECLNMAALWKLPIIFVVENNLWAIGMSHLRATSDPEIWKKGPAFGMPGVHVDGMDVLKVREVAKEAIGRARRGEGPTLVECETYRFRGHSLADPDELRNPGEIASSSMAIQTDFSPTFQWPSSSFSSMGSRIFILNHKLCYFHCSVGDMVLYDPVFKWITV